MKGPCLCGVQVLGRTPATGWMLGSRGYGGVSVAVALMTGVKRVKSEQ